MANRQTRALLALDKSLHFNKGVDFSHLEPNRSTHPEFTIIERPLYRGAICDTRVGKRRRWNSPPVACPFTRDPYNPYI
jgi:hypothetical protein